MLVFTGGGSLQTYVHERSGASAAMLNGFIQVEGTLPFAGTNSLYISNEIGALAGTDTIAAPIGNVTGDTLTDGMSNVMCPGAVIDLGGASAGQIVNIVTIAALSGWTELIFDGPVAALNERTSSKDIGASSVDIPGGSDDISTSSLTSDETLCSSLFGVAMLNPLAGSVSIAGGISINDVIVHRAIASSDHVLTPVTASSRTRPS
jgi:hypothetical protein